MRDKLLAKAVPLYFLFLFFSPFLLPPSLLFLDAYEGRPTTRPEHNFRFRRYSQLRSIISCELSVPVNGKSYYRVTDSLSCWISRSINQDSKVYFKNCRSECKRGLKSFDWKYFFILDRGCLIDDDWTNDGLINEWLKRVWKKYL